MPTHAQAPIDPNVKLPPAVLRNSAASSAAHDRAYKPEQVPDPNAPPPDPNAPANPNAPAPIAAAPVAPPAPEPDEGNWETRYNRMKGRFDKSQQTIDQQQGTIASQGQRLNNLEAMLANMSAAAPAPAPASPELSSSTLVTADERNAYGDEMLDVIGRRAMEAVRPQLAALEQENADLKRQLGGVASHVAGDARQKMIERLNHEVPNWHAQNNDANFLAWLRLQDPFSGAIRAELLRTAFDRNEAGRVLAFFKGFLTEEATVAPAAPAAPAPSSDRPGLDAFASPGRAKSAPAAPGSAAEKPIITRAQISQFYADVNLGKYAGQDEKKASDERMIFEAQRDGRIR
jgi:hypothetical protein